MVLFALRLNVPFNNFSVMSGRIITMVRLGRAIAFFQVNPDKLDIKTTSIWLFLFNIQCFPVLCVKAWSHQANGRVTDKKSFHPFISVLSLFLIR